jgi:hypothetical protein
MIDHDRAYAGGYHAGGSVAQRRFGTTLRRSRFEEATRLSEGGRRWAGGGRCISVDALCRV